MKTFSVLFYRKPDGNLITVPIVAEIPSEELTTINEKIDEIKKIAKSAYKDRLNLKQEVDIRRIAATCESCDLCMVCAGKHRKYESWPAGGEQCFVNMTKSGKPMRDAPCKLCDVHDREVRDFKRSWMQGLSRESTCKNSMNNFIAQRRALYRKYEIETKVVIE